MKLLGKMLERLLAHESDYRGLSCKIFRYFSFKKSRHHALNNGVES